MENSNPSNELIKENDSEKSLNPINQEINKTANESKEKELSSIKDNLNNKIENQTIQIPIKQTTINTNYNTQDNTINNNNKNKENTKRKKFEEKKTNEEEEKRAEEEKIENALMKLREGQVRIREEQIKKLENDYNSLMNNIIKTWSTNRANYENFYNSNVYGALKSILTQPCIVYNTDVIILVFKFLCNYFNFLNENLDTIPYKHMLYLFRLSNDCNLFSVYPKIRNNYNYDII